MQIDIYQIDAFTDKAFGGNPAAVCPLNAWLPDNLLQKIAAENNLSETAFYIPSAQENPHGTKSNFQIRWFTPDGEVDLCGHATLAAAHVLFMERGFIHDSIVFSSKSGLLTVSKSEHGFTMDLPAWQVEKTGKHKKLTAALGAEYKELYKGKYHLALFNDEQTIHAVTPDFKALKNIDDIDFLIITAQSQSIASDFISRFFCPKLGIDEDPVTGSAHCILTPFWTERLGKEEVNAYQASKRGGHLKCTIEKNRVKISGQAVLYLKGQIYV